MRALSSLNASFHPHILANKAFQEVVRNRIGKKIGGLEGKRRDGCFFLVGDLANIGDALASLCGGGYCPANSNGVDTVDEIFTAISNKHEWVVHNGEISEISSLVVSLATIDKTLALPILETISNKRVLSWFIPKAGPKELAIFMEAFAKNDGLSLDVYGDFVAAINEIDITNNIVNEGEVSDISKIAKSFASLGVQNNSVYFQAINSTEITNFITQNGKYHKTTQGSCTKPKGLNKKGFSCMKISVFFLL